MSEVRCKPFVAWLCATACALAPVIGLLHIHRHQHGDVARNGAVGELAHYAHEHEHHQGARQVEVRRADDSHHHWVCSFVSCSICIAANSLAAPRAIDRIEQRAVSFRRQLDYIAAANLVVESSGANQSRAPPIRVAIG